MYKKTSQAFEEIKNEIAVSGAETERGLSVLMNRMEQIDRNINSVAEEIKLYSKQSFEEYEKLNSRIDELCSKVADIQEIAESAKSATDKMIQAVDSVSSALKANNRTAVKTVDSLTAMCTEMLAEYHREVNDSINLLLSDSLIAKIPGGNEEK